MKPLVSVILTHHLNINRPYLDLALRGLESNQEIPYETVLISDAESPPPEPKYGKAVWDKTLDNATKKLHYGFEHVSPDSTYLLILSDDVVVSSRFLFSQVNAIEGRDMIVNPYSNSDAKSLYDANVTLKNAQGDTKPVHADMTLEELAGWEEAIINYPIGPKCLVPMPCVSFYCTMFKKSVLAQVGLLDEALEHRHNDQDFCLRARSIGIGSFVNFGAFAFHFGSRTLMHVSSQQDKDQATEHFKKKWMNG